MMPDDLHSLFPDSAPIDAAATTIETRMAWLEVPAKCAVYLLASGEGGGEPLLVATVGNLRAALQRRLADIPADVHTKRIPYAQLCTRVYWRIVHSPFAANWWYLRSVRALFPERYRELLGWQAPWWIAKERAGDFPRLRRTQDLDDAGLEYAGPVRDRAAAGKLIDTLEDLFDLCRYHHILIQAPHGKACAYKEMGKCPAPCDGSVPLSVYHRQLQAAFEFLCDGEGEGGGVRQTWLNTQQAAMRAAAANLMFELAGRVKQRLERAATMRMEAAEHVAPLEEFAFLVLQPGPGRTTIEPWVVVGGEVTVLPVLKKKELGAAVGGLAQTVREKAAGVVPPLGREAAEQVALVAHHLFRVPRDPGLYLRMRDVVAGGAAFIEEQTGHWLGREEASSAVPELASDRGPLAEEVVPVVDAGVVTE